MAATVPAGKGMGTCRSSWMRARGERGTAANSYILYKDRQLILFKRMVTQEEVWMYVQVQAGFSEGGKQFLPYP